MPCRFSASVSWSPTVSTGFSAVIGSWNTMAACRPRILRRPFASRAVTLRSPNITVPVMLALPGNRPMAVDDVTDLPEPDSPTSATTSPGLMSKVTPLTASTSPNSVSKVTATLSKDRIGAPPRSGWRLTTPKDPVEGFDVVSAEAAS